MEGVFPNTADSNSAIRNEPVQEAYKGASSDAPQTIGVGSDCELLSNDKSAVYGSIANNADSSVQEEACGEKMVSVKDNERVLLVACLNSPSSSLIKSEKFKDAADAATEALRHAPRNWEAYLNRYVMHVITVCIFQHSGVSIAAHIYIPVSSI